MSVTWGGSGAVPTLTATKSRVTSANSDRVFSLHTRLSSAGKLPHGLSNHDIATALNCDPFVEELSHKGFFPSQK